MKGMQETTGSAAPPIQIDNAAIDHAIAVNRRKLYFQNAITSTPAKLVATGFLLTSLFAATFLVAYQSTRRTETKAALKEVPQAEIIIPASIPRTTIETPASFCGGIAGIACPEEYMCKLDGDYPDAGGTCVPLGTELIDKELPLAP